MISHHIQYLHLMYAEVTWVLVSSGTQVQSQTTLDPDYLPGYLSVSYDHGAYFTTKSGGFNCNLFYALRVTFFMRVMSNYLLQGLRVIFCM